MNWRNLVLTLSLAGLFPFAAEAANQVTCTYQTQTPDAIRNEGKTEQIADYVFSCLNTGGTATADVSAMIVTGLPITSKVLSTGSGTTEATLIVTDSTGQQAQQTYLGTVSGSTVSFSNVPIAQSSNTSAYQPFILTITNIRVDATSLSAGAAVSESVTIGGTDITTANFPVAQMATVESGLAAQTVTGAINFAVCSTVTAATPAFTLNFGENSLLPAAFKTQGGNGNTAVGSWETNNTETGFYVQAGATSNVANSGTRLRIVFSNIPANVSVYVPLTVNSAQLNAGGMPSGTLALTTTEAGAYTAAVAAANPPGYTGSVLSQLTVTSGNAEAVYEVVGDAPSVAESYQTPVYLASTGAVATQAAAITAAVSFAPVGATTNFPDFAQLSSTTPLSGSLFPTCLTITNSTLPGGVKPQTYSQAVGVTGGITPYSWSQVGGTLPPGLSLNTGNGAITGTLNTVGTYAFTIGVADSSGQMASQLYSLTVNPALAITTTTIPTGDQNVYYSQALTATGGAGSNSWFLSAGSVPSGMSISSGGYVTGTPTQSGAFTFTVGATDADSDQATQQLTLQVNSALSISTTSLPAAVNGYAYSATLSAANGSGSYTWSIVNGSLYPLTLNSSTGVISGTDPSSEALAFTVQVTDSLGATAQQQLTLTVNPPVFFNYVSMIDGSSPLGYFRLQGSTGSSEVNGYTYAYSTSGAAYAAPGAPIGSTFVNEGAAQLDGVAGDVTTSLSGGVNTAGSILAWVYMTALPSTLNQYEYVAGESQDGNDFDVQFQTDNQLYFYTAAGSNIAYMPASNTLLNQWHMVVATFDSVAGVRAIYWDGNLVASDAGQIYTNKPGNFEIGASSVFGGRFFDGSLDEVATWNYALTAAQVAQFYATPTASFEAGSLGQPYGPVTLSAGGGSGSYTWSATGLPNGITLSSAGVLSGTPSTAVSSAPIMLTVTDGVTGQMSQQSYALTVNPGLSVTTLVLPNGVALLPYSQMLAAGGGTGTGYQWQTVEGSLPDGVTLSTAGVLSGTPTVNGSFAFTAQVTDSGKNTALMELTLTVDPAVSITTGTLAGSEQGLGYSQTLTATGGYGTYTWALGEGSTLPAGLSLSSGGVLSGTPTVAAGYAFTVNVQDSSGSTATQTYSMYIYSPLTILTTSLPAVNAGSTFSTGLLISGGAGGLTYNLLSSSPAGAVSLTEGGSLAIGWPTPTTVTFVEQVIDSLGAVAMQQLTVTINMTVTISTNYIHAGIQNIPYSKTLNATGGVGSLQWNIVSGTLPPGLSLSSGGPTATQITGTPTAAGQYPFTVQVSDTDNDIAQMNYTLFVSAPGTIIQTNLPSNTAIVNIDATQNGIAYSDGDSSSAYLEEPFNSNGQSIAYTVPAGTYTFRIIDPADATSIFPALTGDQTSGIFTASGLNQSWFTTYAAFPDTAVGNIDASQLFTGADGGAGTPDAPSAYNAAVSGGSYNEIFVGSRDAAPTMQYTFSYPTTLIFSVPNGASDGSAGGVSVLIAPVATTPLSITTQSLAADIAGVSYPETTLMASGGSGNYVWTATNLPTGLTLSSGGVLSGTPTTSGPMVTATVTVTDPVSGLSVSQNFCILIAAPLTIGPASLPAAMTGTYYDQYLTGSGGIGTYTFSLLSGSLPAGVNLGLGGMLCGTPTVSGSFPFTALIMDSNGDTATMPYTLLVNSTVSISTATLPAATQGTAYNQTVSASGGVQPYTWSITSGAANFLSAGLTLNSSTGAITGTPVTADTLTFAVQVTDNSENTSSQSLNLFINLANPATYDFAVVNEGSGIERVSADGMRTSSICSGAPCHPQDITTDLAGNIYAHNNTGIAMITPAGVVTQILPFSGTPIFGAGAGVGGLILDGLGNIIFVDNDLDAIFRVKTDGTGLVQVAAFPTPSPEELQDTYVALDHSGNYVVVSDAFGEVQIYRFAPSGSETTLGTYPGRGSSSVAVDASGNVIFLDYQNQVVASVNAEGTLTVITPIGSLCCTPVGMALDPATGNYIVSTSGSNELLRMTQTGTVTTILNGSPLSYPVSVAPIALLTTGPLTITPTALASGMAGQSYGPVTMMASGGSGVYTWAATGLPAGIALSTAGVLSGIPTVTGSFTAQITATDSETAQTGSASLAISIGMPLTISSGTSAFGTIAVGQQINTTYTAAGGAMPYLWASTGILPSGLTLSSGGLLSGTLTQPGNYSFTVQVTDAEPAMAAATVTISVLGITTASPLPTAVSGVAYTATLSAAGGSGSYTFTATGLPSGLSISSAGVISGTTTVTGPAVMVSITVTDSNHVSSTSPFGLTVSASPVNVSTTSLPNPAVGIPYSQTLSAAGGAQPYTWTLAGGTLPGGLTLSSAGTISGTPTQGGPFSFTVKGTDTNGASGTALLSVTVSSAVTITTTSLPNGTANQTYGPVTVTATGGSGSYTWTATGLPGGVSIGAATGTIGGNPSGAGSFSAMVTATDTSTHQTGSQTYNFSVASSVSTLTITSAPSPAPVVAGGTVSATFTASGGKPPYTWTASGLPANVSVSSGGVLSGAPGQPGVFTASVTVTDTQPTSTSTNITVSVFGLTSAGLPNGVAGQFYSASIGAVGGTGPYSFSGTGLPSGLSLSAAGNITGTVTTAGSYNFTVKANDSGGLSVSQGFTVTFSKPQAIAVTSSSLPNGTVNTPYSQTLSASGGFAPYTWTVSSGAIPAGFSLSSAGTVSGIPMTPGSFSFGVMATDSSGAIATAAVSLTIQPAPLSVTTQSLPSGVSSFSYPQQVLEASGGVQPYTWAVTTGTLPSGLSLSSAGSLTGTPSGTGNFPITVSVTDAAGSTSTASYGLTIRDTSVDLIISNSSMNFSLMNPAAVVPSAQSAGVQSTQFSQPIGYSVSASPAAPWLTLSNGSTTPDTIQVAVSQAGLTLAAGNYSTMVSVKCTSSTCAGSTQNISVSLNVAAGPPQLQVTTNLLSFGAATTAAQPIAQSITIQNAGGGSLGIGNVSCEASWCTAGAGPGTLAGGVSGSIPVSIDPALLTAGFFRTQVDIVTSAGSASVPVTVLVSAMSSMTLAPMGSQFTMQVGGAPGNPSGSFLVTVTNGSAVNWSASVLPGAPWLTLASTGGSASASAPGTVSFGIDPVAGAALAPGVYYGQIQVASSGIVNSPQSYEVVLSVAPTTTAVIPAPDPQGLLFITSVGGAPPPQTVTIYSGSTVPTGFQASATTSSGGGWLSVSPNIGSAGSGSPGMTSVTVNTTGLPQGVYTGGVSYSLSATAVRVVNVTLIVAPAGTGAQVISHAASPHAAGVCTPSVLVPVQTGLVNSFSAAVAWPTPLEVTLANDCGSLVTNGQLVATFTNGDPPLPLALADAATGIYSGTWTPRKAVAQMTVTANASAPGYPSATAVVVGAATPNQAPLLTPNGTLHSFDPLVGAALAPGTIIQIYGQNLASQVAQPTSIPLPTTMNGTSVIVGGIPAPLYYVSAGQINAQLPFELNAGNTYQLIVSANGALTTPDTVQLSGATPGLAAFADSTLIAQHGDGSLVSTTAPAVPGEYLVAYLAGMGDTNATPQSGAASPSNPLAVPAVQPVLTLNGTSYPIAFAGLTPGLVGLYQMNFQVPAGLPAGNLTLVVSQSGQASNQTVLPYQP